MAIGRLAGRSVAFLPRHGTAHQFPPHRVNYRANLWALRSVGVRQVLAPSAVGSLRPELGPGTVVVPDQVVDRTWGRPHTVYDTTGSVVHVSFGDPYCPRGRRAVVGARDDVVDGGTLVVINGPTVLQSRGVPLARRPGVVGGRHDRSTGGGHRPRARPLLHLCHVGDGP